MILIVDDEPAVRNLFKVILQKAGFLVKTAENSRMALELLHHNDRFTLVITDNKRSGIGGAGEEFSRVVKELRPNLPILMATGSPPGTYDVDKVLLKPFNHEDLVGAVKDLLSK